MILLAQSAVDAEALAKADAQQVLAYVVAALVVTVIFLFGLLLKQQANHTAKLDAKEVDYEAKRSALESKVDALTERLLRVTVKTSEILTQALGPKED